MGKCAPSGGRTPFAAGVGKGPTNGKLNSMVDIFDPRFGETPDNPHTQRWFGPDGLPVWDRNFRHGGGRHRFPHDHRWVDGHREEENLEPSGSC